MWIHLLTTELIRGAEGGYNTWWDGGYWAEQYLKMWNRPAKAVKQEIADAVKESPKAAIEAMPTVKAKVKEKYGEIDYSQVISNAKMQRYVISLILAEMERQRDEEDIELLLLT